MGLRGWRSPLTKHRTITGIVAVFAECNSSVCDGSSASDKCGVPRRRPQRRRNQAKILRNPNPGASAVITSMVVTMIVFSIAAIWSGHW